MGVAVEKDAANTVDSKLKLRKNAQIMAKKNYVYFS